MQKTLIQKRRWYNRKSLIRINCWIMVLLFVVILLFMGFPIVSNASDNDSKKLSDFYFCDSFLNSVDAAKYDGYSVDVSNYPFDSPFLESVDSSLYSKFFDFTPSDLGITDFFPENYNLYFFYNIDDDSNYIVLVPDNLLHDEYDSFGRFSWTYNAAFIGYKVNSDFTLTRVDFPQTPDGFKLVYGSSNVPNGGNFGFFYLNYLYLQNKMGKGEGGYSGSDIDNTFPDGSGGNDSNNLYMRTADWQFNIPKYWPSVTSATTQSAYTSQWGSGSIIFYGLLNDYQNEYANNFNLDFNFHIWCSGHYFNDVNSSVNGNFYGSFNYNNVTVPLRTFINQKNNYSFNVSDIFSNAVNSSGQTFSNFIDTVKVHQSIDKWNWYISCDASLSSSSSRSGHIVEKYDFISQSSIEDSNNITNNSNPYIPPEDSGASPDSNINKPDNGTSYSSNGGNIVINNNPTITNSNNNNSNISNVVEGNGNPFNLLIDSLFGDGTVQEGSIGGNVQEKLITMTGANRWLAVINDSMSWIPSSVWAEIMVFVGVTLGILVVAFILRIILDFL